MKQSSLRSGAPRFAARALSLWLGCGLVAFAQQYTISTIAGGAPPSTPVAATSTSIGPPQRVATDSTGNVYFTSLNCVFRLDANGTLTLVAGNSREGFSGDGGPATQAQLSTPQGLAWDASGDLFIADTGNNRIREVTPDGIIQTIAGNGQPGFYPITGPATESPLQAPTGVAVDSSGNLYIADSGNHTIRRVTPDGIIHTFAGTFYAGFYGDGSLAISANLHGPQDVAIGANGVVYIADTGNSRIRAVGTDGNINTVVGSGGVGIAGDGGKATDAAMSTPNAVVVDSAGNIFIADLGNNRIRKVDSKGTIITVVGNGIPTFGGDGADATKASLNQPAGVAVDSSGNLYIADEWNLRIRKLSSGNISTVAGNGQVSYSGDGGSATLAQLNSPQGVAVDAAGNLYIADSRNAAIRKVSVSGTITTVSGVSLALPRGLASDAAGNLYVADYQGNKVSKIATDGTVTTIAGTGTAGYSGDDGPATSAQLHGPFGLALDHAGNLYIADFANNVVREVSPAGVIITVAGNTVAGYSGDGGPAALASLDGPFGVAVGPDDTLYIADTNNHVIRWVNAKGVISTIAGTGVPGFAGDGGPALQAQITAPAGIAVDSAGIVYISDAGLHIRRIYPGSVITTIAGGGVAGYSGDGGIATLAALNGPSGIALGASGSLVIADTGNNAIRRLQPGGSTITLQAVTNGASNLPGAVAPGEVVVLYGTGLGPSQLTLSPVSANGTLPTSLGGTSVYFNGVAAPIIYTSPSQVGAVVPFGVTGSSVQVIARYQNQAAPPVSNPVAAVAPALFTLDYTGKGQAAALNPNLQPNGAGNPAAVGSHLMLFATGLGQTSPQGTDGLLAPQPPPAAGQPVTVTIGGVNATVVSATAVVGEVEGVMQVTVQVPAGVQAGNAVPVTLQVGTVSAPTGVTVAIAP